MIVGVFVGVQSKIIGKDFWNGFANHLNEKWAQTLAITTAIYLISVGLPKLFDMFSDCFIAGTLVLTESGLVKIEDIKPGDKVYAYDEKTNKKQLKEVKQVFRNKTKEWLHLVVQNTKTNEKKK